MARGGTREHTQRRRHPWVAASAVVTLLTAAAAVSAQVTTAGGGSLLVWPKVVADGTRDTVILLENRTNRRVDVTCYYVRGDDASCDSTPFAVVLNRQQPTHWRASVGRSVTPGDPECSPSNNECDGAGTDPGAVPAVPSGFAGALLCFETDPTGYPLPGNSLAGWATVSGSATADTARYGALAFPANADVLPMDVLNLNDTEYAACPATWSLNHAVDGSFDPLVGDTSSISNRLTIVPCAIALGGAPTSVNLDFSLQDELGQTFATATTVSCWADLSLSAIDSGFTFANRGGAFYARTIVSADPGVVLLLEDSRIPGVESGADDGDRQPASRRLAGRRRRRPDHLATAMSGLSGRRMASCGVRVMGLAMLLVQLLAPRIASAQEVADQAAALVVFPYVVVDSATGVDTLFQLSNAGESVVAVRCFYENATHYCSNNADNGVHRRLGVQPGRRL